MSKIMVVIPLLRGGIRHKAIYSVMRHDKALPPNIRFPFYIIPEATSSKSLGEEPAPPNHFRRLLKRYVSGFPDHQTQIEVVQSASVATVLNKATTTGPHVIQSNRFHHEAHPSTNLG